MSYTIYNPRWSDVEHTAILCTLVSDVHDEINFQAMPTDPELLGRTIYEECVAGKYGAIAPYLPDPQALLNVIEAQRDAGLRHAEIATRGLNDAFVAGILDTDQASRFREWASYQLALRTLEQQAGFPEQIEWPTAPAPIFTATLPFIEPANDT